MIIGLTGSFAAGKGETVRGTVARGCQIFLERANKNINNLNRVCKTLAPHQPELVKKFI